MKKQRKSVGSMMLVVLLLIVMIVSLVLATFAWAKYFRTIHDTANTTAAKWNVTLSKDTGAFVGQYNHVVNTKIAPGTEGSFDVSIALNDTEVCVAYQVLLDNITFTGTNAEQMTHLKLATTKTGDVYSGFLTPTAANVQEGTPAVSAIAFSGIIDLKDVNGNTAIDNGSVYDADRTVANAEIYNGTPTSIPMPTETGSETTGSTKITRDENGKMTITKTIYWVWPYDYDDAVAKGITPAETDTVENEVVTKTKGQKYDEADTLVGEGTAAMNIGFTVRAWQVAPADGANDAASNSKTQTTQKNN